MLKITEISKTFNQGTINEKRALCKVSLTMQDGDFATIVGSNGAGKSTLFNQIGKQRVSIVDDMPGVKHNYSYFPIFIADEGSIILDGKDITFEKEHRRSRMIGRLFQDPLMGTAPHMSIEENLSVAYLRASAEKTSFFGKIAQDFTGITAKER